MKIIKPVKCYYFSVEGKTEKLYLDWLQGEINKKSEIYAVEFISKDWSPLKYTKKLVNFIEDEDHENVEQFEIFHICDYEGGTNTKRFFNILSEMREACRLKNINYKLCYSNFTFELWIILHKIDCYTRLSDKTQYLKLINKAYDTNFRSLHDYKKEDHFKKGILDKLTLDDVSSAINRAKSISVKNKKDGYKECEYKGYKFYKENPSLSIYGHIKKILRDCDLYK